MITRKDVSEAIEIADQEFKIAWNTIMMIKSAVIKNFSLDELLALQPAIATGIYGLAKIYHALSAEKKLFIARKKTINASWFANRLRLISQYQEAIKTAICIGKNIGDAFAWFFYHNERQLLLKHSKHEKILIPPIGIGGKGEIEFIKNMQFVDGYILIHHGITNILRFGDISIISIADMRVVAVAEIKTHSKEEKVLNISMILTSNNKDKFEKLTRTLFINSTKKTKIENEYPNNIQTRLKNQLKQISKVLNNNEPNYIHEIKLEKNIKDLERIFFTDGREKVTVNKIGQSQVVIRTDLKQTKLADRLMIGPSPSIIPKAKGLIEEIIGICVQDKRLNNLYIAEIFNPSAKTRSNPAFIPIIWQSLDNRIIKSLIFHETVLISVFNTGPFLLKLQNLGFIISVKEHSYSAEKQIGEKSFILGNLESYYDFIILGLFSEESIVKIITKAMDSCEYGVVPIGTKVEISIIEYLYKTLY